MKSVTKIIGIVCLLMASCTSIRYIPIQVLIPPKIMLPEKVNTIIITDHKYYKINADSFFYNIGYYKLMEDSFNTSLKQSLQESPLFTNTKIIITSLQEYLKKNNNDLYNGYIINIDSIAFKDTVQFYNNRFAEFLLESVECLYQFEYKLKVSIRNLKNKTYDTFKLTDTLEWSYNGYSISDAIQHITQTQMAAGEAGNMAGMNYAQRIAPYWPSEERAVFKNLNKQMRKGFTAFSAGKFATAISYWKPVCIGKNNNIAAMAAFNIALCYEFMDDLISAEEWLYNSKAIKKSKLTDDYLKQLKTRNKDKLVLDKLLN